MKALSRLRHVIRIELGHALLGKLEEHRFKIRSLVKYEGPIDALKAIKSERDERLHYGYIEDRGPHGEITWRNELEYEPTQLSRKRWRKDSQLFI